MRKLIAAVAVGAVLAGCGPVAQHSGDNKASSALTEPVVAAAPQPAINKQDAFKAKLQQRITVEFDGSPIYAVLEELNQRTDIPVYVPACAHFPKVSFHAKSMTVENAFFWSATAGAMQCYYEDGKLFLTPCSHYEISQCILAGMSYDDWLKTDEAKRIGVDFNRPVSVNYDNLPLGVVIKEMMQYAGYPIVVSPGVITEASQGQSKMEQDQRDRLVSVTYKVEGKPLIAVIDDITSQSDLKYVFIREVLYVFSPLDYAGAPPPKPGPAPTADILEKKVSFDFLETGICCAFAFLNRVIGFPLYCQIGEPYNITLSVENMRCTDALFWIGYMTDRACSIRSDVVLLGKPDALVASMLFPEKRIGLEDLKESIYAYVKHKTKAPLVKSNTVFERHINLEGNAEPLRQVVRFLAKTTGCSIVVARDVQDVDIIVDRPGEKRPLIELIDDIVKKHGLDYSFVRGALFICNKPYDAGALNKAAFGVSEAKGDNGPIRSAESFAADNHGWMPAHACLWPADVEARVTYFTPAEYEDLKFWLRLWGNQTEGWTLLPAKSIAAEEGWRTEIEVQIEGTLSTGSLLDSMSFAIILGTRQSDHKAFASPIMSKVKFNDLTRMLQAIHSANPQAIFRIGVMDGNEPWRQRMVEVCRNAGILPEQLAVISCVPFDAKIPDQLNTDDMLKVDEDL